MSTVARAPAPRPSASALAPTLWSVALALLMLGPALAPGFVLSYDMVWVPDLALRPDALGLGSGLPRAVPSDAVVAVLDEVVPGTVLQKAVLVAALAGGGLGVAALLREAPLGTRLVGVSLYQWNPYVVERLLIGHWPVLLAYAALPWLVLQTRRARERGRPPAAWWALLAVGSLSASAGLVTAVTVLALVLPAARERGRLVLTVALGLVAANAPWVVAGLLHVADATADPDGAALFALDGVALLPAPLAAMGLGGIWNGEVVLPSRDTVAAPAALALVLVLAALGARRWAARVPAVERHGLLAAALLGWVLAVLTWAAPGFVGWMGEAVPGGGLLRDGARLLALVALPATLLAAHGAESVATRLPTALGRGVTFGTLALLPVTVLPDAALGASGRLEAVDYPDAFDAVRTDLAARHPGGDVLVLPFASYRAPAWNGGRKVLDPTGRYLTQDAVVSDELWVDGERIEGEDPRAARVLEVLGLGSEAARAEGLTAMGIGSVVVDGEQAAVAPSGSVPPIAGSETIHGAFTVVTLAGEVRPFAPPAGWRWAMAAAWTAYVGTLVLSVGLGVLGRRRKGASA